MLSAGIKTPMPLEELESHLREEIERQMRMGVNTRFAFDIAVTQIGRGKELKTEFSKERRWRDILETELIKKEWDLKWGPILHLAIMTALFLIAGSMVVLLGAGMTAIEEMTALTAVAIFYSLSWGGWLGYKFFPAIPNYHIRLGIYAAGAVMISVWLIIFVPSYALHELALAKPNMHQLGLVSLWAFLVPLGAFSGLVLGLERAAQKKAETAGS